MRRIMWRGEVEARFNLVLDPCPFCNSFDIGLYDGPNPHITCNYCKADGPYLEGSDNIEYKQHQACIKWNRS